MALNGLNDHFTVNFHYFELTLRVVIYLFAVESVDIHMWPAEMCGIFGIRWKTADLPWTLHRWKFGTL